MTDCTVCYLIYDNNERFPMILVPCGHSICKECTQLMNSLTRICPFCRERSQMTLKNYQLVELLQ
jgi:hypothetical protein